MFINVTVNGLLHVSELFTMKLLSLSLLLLLLEGRALLWVVAAARGGTECGIWLCSTLGFLP